MDEVLHPLRLSTAKLGVLYQLMSMDEPVALGVLSEHLHCARSNVTQLIDRLERDNLLRRIPDPDDRRSVRAEITQEGRKRFQAGMKAAQDTWTAILSPLESGDQQDLGRILERMMGGESR